MATLARHHTTPGETAVAPTENLTTALWEHERQNPDHPILSYRKGNAFRHVTYAEMAEKVRRIAAGFIALGAAPGTRICIFSPTRHEFTLLDYAIWAAGCATVTIYDTSSPEQVRWIVEDSGADLVVCADDDLRGVLDEALEGSSASPRAFVIDSGGLDEIVAAGTGVGDDRVMERARSMDHDHLATLVYTSGTTGMPKGCELTVRNFVWTVRQSNEGLADLI